MNRATLESAREADREARRAAACDFDRPIALSAGAGTGKTGTLASRAVAWCLGPGWERSERSLGPANDPSGSGAVAARTLERVVAVTFTERAAVEMAERVASAFAKIRAGEEVEFLPPGALVVPNAELPRRAASLLASLDRLAVGTIHAFCRRLLATYPLEAGLHPAFEVDAEGTLTRKIAEELVAERLRLAYGDPGDDDWVALASLGKGPDRVAGALASLAASAVPPEVLAEDPLSPERVRETADRLAERVARVHRVLAPHFSGGPWGNMKKAMAAYEGLEALRRELALVRSAGDLAELATTDSAGTLREVLDKWRKREFTQTEGKRLDAEADLPESCEELLSALSHFARLDPALFAPARRVLASLLAETVRRMRARGVQTFSGLLAGARDLLARHPQVLARVRGGIDQLLVDEFQDTDPIQCEVFGRIALEGPRDERPGLFVVGDPKQSIFGWRSADLAAYEAFVRRLEDEGGCRHELVVNFRSAPPILEEVERTLRPLLVERAGVQAPFQVLVPAPQNEGKSGFHDGDRRPVEHWVSWDPGEGGGPRTGHDRAREIEAAAVASDLALLHAAGVEWKRAAILVRTTGVLETYLEPLRAAGIPYVVERDRNFYRRREVIDAASLVRAIVDPNDHVALVSLLRSPVVGTPDAALLPLWGRGFPGLASRLAGPDPDLLAQLDRIVSEARREVPRTLPGLSRLAGWERSLTAALRSLAELRRSFAADPVDIFVGKVRALFLSEETQAARFLGRYRLANLRRFFRRLLAGMVSGDGGPQGALRELREAVAEARAEEEGSPGDETIDAVRVLTIHKAKGLTFDHVYVVGLHGEIRGDRDGDSTEAVPLGGNAARGGQGAPGGEELPPGRQDGAGGGGGGEAQDGRSDDRRGARAVWEIFLLGAPGLDFDLVEERRRRVSAAEAVRALYVAVTRPRERLVLAGSWPGHRDAPPPDRAKSLLDLLESREGKRTDLEAFFDAAREGREGTSRDEGGARWFFPALEAPAPPVRTDALPPSGDLLPRARRAAKELARARESARERMVRPYQGTASERSHEVLRELLADAAPEGETEPGELDFAARSQALREIALAAGTAVHHALERFDLAALPERELERQRGLLAAHLATFLPPGRVEEVRADADRVLAGLAGSKILARLREIAPRVLGREVPVLLPGDENEGPVGVRVGTLDLLYEDPADGSLVVADYKTDSAPTPADIEERARAYAPQGATYLAAVRRALGESRAVRFELWFLAADRIELVATG